MASWVLHHWFVYKRVLKTCDGSLWLFLKAFIEFIAYYDAVNTNISGIYAILGNRLACSLLWLHIGMNIGLVTDK